jgi:hypothetical protein
VDVIRDAGRTGTPVVWLESIFLEGKLVVDPLDLREVEVWFSYENREFRDTPWCGSCSI